MALGSFEEYDECNYCGWFMKHTIYEKICPKCGSQTFSSVIAKEKNLKKE